MEKQSFSNLLTDLLQYYNPAKIADITMLVGKYQGREFDGAKVIFIKYNSKYNPDKFNPDFGTDEHVLSLLRNYSEGNRIFSKENMDKGKQKADFEKENEDKKLKETIIGEASGQLKKVAYDEAKENIEKYFNSKAIDFEKHIEELLKNKNEEIQKATKKIDETIKTIEQPKLENTIDVKLTFLNFGKSDLVLPNEDFMRVLGIGERMIVRDSEGRMCGLSVEDITYDVVSDKDKVTKDISLKKV